MMKEQRHLTLHGYIEVHADKTTYVNMFEVTRVEPKLDHNDNIKEENDEYLEKLTSEEINNWDLESNELSEIEEPAALQSVLGVGFVSVSADFFAEMKITVDVHKALLKAEKAEKEVREELMKM